MEKQNKTFKARLLVFGCLAFLPQMQALTPPPDGCYPNFTTAEGCNALRSLTTGAGNTGVGWRALFLNTDASFNTAVGAGALILNNGSTNTAVGTVALLLNTTGVDNTAVGTGALQNSTGNHNIGLGAAAGIEQTTGSNNIYIGDTGVSGESNVIAIGASSNVAYQTTYIGGIYGTTTGGTGIPIVIDSAGQLGTNGSSRRFKKEIRPMDKTSEAILALKPVTFHYKSDNTRRPEFGLIAEDVAKVNPDLVVRDKEGEIYTVRYEAVNAMLLNEFLKEHRKMQELETMMTQRQKAFESQLADQKKQIESLTADLRKVSAQIEASKSARQVAINR